MPTYDRHAGAKLAGWDTEAVYLYGLDILAQQQSERRYSMHDGLALCGVEGADFQPVG